LPNHEHLATLQRGVQAWADWREKNPDIPPDLEEANLAGLDLHGVDFRCARLRRANLQGAQLTGANLEGANLREANLRGADLKNATGVIQAEQFAGADVSGASLPESLAAFLEDTETAAEISANAQKLFIAMLAACLYSWLTIAATTDVSLVTNRASTPLPVIQTSIPIVSFYIVTPLLLLGVYFYCHFYLQKLWDELGALPAIFPDGRPLQTKTDPWLLSDLARSHVWKLRETRPFLAYLQAWVSVLLAWWIVPATLLLFWLRYLPRHDFTGTLLHAILAAAGITAGVHLYQLAAATLRGNRRQPFSWRLSLASPRTYRGAALALLCACALSVISSAAIKGIRTSVSSRDCWPQSYQPIAWVPWGMSKLGFPPFADLSTADLSLKPPNWTSNTPLDSVKGLQLHGADLRYADLSFAFLPVSVLTEAHLEWAELVAADLRQTVLSGAYLSGAVLAGADLTDADVSGADIKYADLRGVKGLSADQVKKAKNWDSALYDDTLAAQLGFGSDHNESVEDRLKRESGSVADRAACEIAQLRGLAPGTSKATSDLVTVLYIQHNGGNVSAKEVTLAAPTSPAPGQPTGLAKPSVGAPSRPWFTVSELVKLYNFPQGADGRGQTIGIIEFGGGYKNSDLATYFAQSGITKPSEVSAVSVDGVKNNPSQIGESAETQLDVEVTGTVAPAAKIVVYFTSFTLQGWIDAIRAAAHDTEHRPSVLLICWGFSENSALAIWSTQGMQAVNQVLQEAAMSGITVVVASGADGAGNGETDGAAHVDFPASSPWVLAVGGTRLIAKGGQITSETPWNDEGGTRRNGGGATGGGVSEVFPQPSWQASAHVPTGAKGQNGRGIPDVAANASAHTGYRVFIGGQWIITGATSASASLWAGFIALLNQQLGRNLGYFNPLLYQKLGPAGALRNVTGGDNGGGGVKGYACTVGWNACTGWGTPDGKKLIDALRSLQ
jgi:uncharacterized protein YjbI with pentapeptide repeats